MKLWIALLLLCTPVFAHAQADPPEPGSVTLSWTASTQNTDGTPLTDLAGYNIYYGTVSGNYPNKIELMNPGATTFVVDNLAPSTYFFVATALNAAGIESDLSNQAIKTVSGPPPTVVPAAPTGLTVTDMDVFNVVKQRNFFLLVRVGTVPAGTQCDPDQSVNGHYAVPRELVTWSASDIKPEVVVAKCF